MWDVGLHKTSTPVLHPNQFQVNEAWLVFRLNDAPVRTETEGEFNCIALMDAASCFILGSVLVPTSRQEPTKIEARRLLKQGWAHKKELPKTLFTPTGEFTKVLPPEAQRQGITVVPVPEDQLLLFIGEARESFKEHFGGSGTQ